jgi:GTP:adenosylcobinamide-phosphate guanylyltransferase
MSDTEKIKDFEIEITVKVKEKNRESYSRDVELFTSSRTQTLMADSSASMVEIKKEVLLNVRDTEKVVTRFFEKKFN